LTLGDVFHIDDLMVGMVGRTISHYRILSPLGSGGMGVVYEAEDTRLGRHVALKLLSPELCSDAQAMERFLREARIVSSMSHPHICTLHDIGEDDGQQFMVMELLEGESLKQRLTRGPLPLDDLLDLGVQIADALDAAHSHGVVHRDVKPPNLFITRRGIAKVLDFGVAKLSQAERADAADLQQTIAITEVTTTGSAIGTVSYMSPEQARGQEIDARSDLFSLGVVLYEMATAKQPFPGATPAVIFEGILTKDPIPPSELNANIPPEFDRIVFKALDKDRETRYQSAGDVRADLKRLKRETESGRTLPASGATPVSTMVTAPRSRRGAVFVGAPLVIAAAIAGVVFWQSQRAPALTVRDTVVLADFTNRTGDTMFDDTLSEALGVQLRQSPFLNLLPEQQVQSTLRLMGRDAMTPVTSEVAREVCQRTSARATLGGSIASLGSSYVLTLRAIDCVSGATLAEEQVSASSKERVIAALGDAASKFRTRLGESLAMVQRYDTRVEEATTPSLEALKAYSQGMTMRRTQGDFDSVPFFRRAIELDGNFALAHARLGTVLSNLGQAAEGEKAAARAYELRERVSERERLYIEARYYTTVAHDQVKAIEAYRLLLATYPDDYAAHTNIGGLYRTRGMVKEAIVSLEEAVRLAPDQPLSHANLGYAYLEEDRFDDARRVLERTLKLQDSTSARNGLFIIATITGDKALADAQTNAVQGRRDEVDHIGVRAQAAGFKGQMKEAARLGDDWFQRTQAAKRLEVVGEGFVGLALAQAMTGRINTAREQLDRVRKNNMIGDGSTDEVVALAAILGDDDLAQSFLERAIQHVRKVNAPETADDRERSLRACAALAAGRNQDAHDLASSVATQPAQREAVFIAGLAALGMQRWDDAVKAFNRTAEFRGKLGLSPVHAVTQVMLGRAHAGAGRATQARAAYEEAFKLWNDADPDLPLLVEARKEYASLGT
jgi:tetratricopeptide (TPR) repeat protein/tRNA A-37 threonylcarbamoyl transferase component Bud32